MDWIRKPAIVRSAVADRVRPVPETLTAVPEGPLVGDTVKLDVIVKCLVMELPIAIV